MRSAAEPRICRRPASRYSQVEDVADQAELAGLILSDWQKDVLRVGLGEREDGKWSAFELGLVVGRQQGKGSILEARALAGLLLLDEELVLWSAHEYKTAMEMFRRVRSRIHKLGRRVKDNLYDYDGILIKVNNTNGDEGFERLDTEQRIQFIARTKNAGRGFSADCLIWDEAFALTEDQVDAQMPVLLARPNPQIWYTSSPPLDAISGAQLFRVRRRAIDGGQKDLAYFEWGAEGCLDDLSGIDLDDRDLWYRVLPSLDGVLVTEEGVQRQRSAMTDAGFAREVMCIWPPDVSTGFQVIPEVVWNAAEAGDGLRAVSPVAFAVEVTLDRRWACIAVAGRRPDGLRQVQIVDHAPDTDWIAPRIRELVDRWNPCAVVVAGGGPAGSIITDLEADGIEVLKPTVQEFARAAGAFYDGICAEKPEARDIRHLGEQALNQAVAGAVKRVMSDGAWTWGRLKSSVDVSPLMAVTLALWGHAARAHLFDQYDLLESVA